MEYSDKVVIVTGGSKGIGEGCVRVFVEAGSRVVFCARRREAGEALAREVTAKGPGEAHFVACDVSKVEDIRRLVEGTVERYGRIDCLINNAGWHPPHKPIDGAPDPARCRADGEAAQVLGRMGTIEETGRLCLFLAAEATFTTGVDHVQSGGAELGYGRKTRH